jgi:DNA uptake protein ComE-like DNA-binding protein
MTNERSAVRDVPRLWWIVFALCPFWTQWASFVYAGLRAHRPRWLAFGGLYAAIAVASFVGVDTADESVWDDVGTAGTFVVWLVALIHAIAIRHEYLARLDLLEDPRLGAAKERLSTRELAEELAEENPRLALESGIGRPDVPGAFDGGLVDLNHAAAAALARVPGVDRRLAHRIVLVRERIDGFDSVDDAGALLDLPAALVDTLRERAVCLPR